MENNPPDTITGPWNYADAAKLTLLLYFFGYAGGLVANIWFLVQARRCEGHTGQKPQGVGCLWTMLALAIFPVVFAVVWILIGVLFPESGQTIESLRRTFHF
ncbi:MAG: hypothetical protein R6V19_04640 [Armatimonadota bacterium]